MAFQFRCPSCGRVLTEAQFLFSLPTRLQDPDADPPDFGDQYIFIPAEVWCQNPADPEHDPYVVMIKEEAPEEPPEDPGA